MIGKALVLRQIDTAILVFLRKTIIYSGNGNKLPKDWHKCPRLLSATPRKYQQAIESYFFYRNRFSKKNKHTLILRKERSNSLDRFYTLYVEILDGLYI